MDLLIVIATSEEYRAYTRGCLFYGAVVELINPKLVALLDLQVYEMDEEWTLQLAELSVFGGLRIASPPLISIWQSLRLLIFVSGF